MSLFVFVVVICAIVLIARFVNFTRFNKPSAAQYKPRLLMTNNELEFFHRIRRAALDGYVFPQVAMSGLIEPVSAGNEPYQTSFRRISQKRVDYVVFDVTMKLLAVIELDDRTHDSNKDAVRDAQFMSAGIPTLRYESKNKPTESKIQADLVAILLQKWR